MRLVEFLIFILEAHAETLKRLAALLGEENLVQLLEMAGEEEAGPPTDRGAVIRLHDFESPAAGSPSAPYAELEGAVQDMNLPAVLQFHLWAYPHYRAFIESPLDLNSRIPGPSAGQNNDVGMVLVDEAVAQAEAWAKKLPVSALVSQQVLRTAHVPWLRFRSTALKRIGRRPLGPVY